MVLLFTRSSSSAIILVFILQNMILSTKSSSPPVHLYNTCYNDTMFANNSQYHTNLNHLFHYLSSNATTSATGFYYATAGITTQDPVYGLFLCRGDQSTTSCSTCVSAATNQDLPTKYCPNRKVAVIWYEECMVRYSNDSFYGVMDQIPGVTLWDPKNITRNKSRFQDVLGKTMNEDISIKAAKEEDGRKYATKVVNIIGGGGSEKLYALVQCTPDLSAHDCGICLRIAIGGLPINVDASVLLASCMARYSLHPFFNHTVDSSSAPPPMTNGKGMKKVSSKLIVTIVVPVSSIIAMSVAIVIYHVNMKAKEHASFVFQNGDDFTDVEALHYDLGILELATNHFSVDNELGKGGFGVVYKGILANGQEIAVKKLSRGSSQGVQEFKNEVLLLAKLQHINLVRLLGFCLARDDKILVYEHVPNKSLDYFLFDHEKVGLLDWGARYNIIGGIARGILYLHQDSRLRIIHRDLKPSNILLDMDMNPKIADFGMARIFNSDQFQTTTNRVVGTYGYMSPEYAMKGYFSVKSDVYSFGVLLLEIVSGKKNTSFHQTGYAEDLLTFAWKKWKDETLMELVDPTISDSCPADEAMRCMQLGLLCVQQSVYKRPTMTFIVTKLDSHSTTLPNPEQPGFFINHELESNSTSKGNRSNPTTSISGSVNHMSVTIVEPR